MSLQDTRRDTPSSIERAARAEGAIKPRTD
jgi:hypothetical protein